MSGTEVRGNGKDKGKGKVERDVREKGANNQGRRVTYLQRVTAR